MKIQKKFMSIVLGLAVVMAPLMTTTSASALTSKQFTLTSDPTTASVDLSHITLPPLPGQPLTIQENLKDSNGQLAGSGTISCVVLAFTAADLLLDCNATFTLTDGVIKGHAIFWTFQHDYPAFVLSGTGAYQNATGVVRILDRSPGDETYIFKLVML